MDQETSTEGGQNLGEGRNSSEQVWGERSPILQDTGLPDPRMREEEVERDPPSITRTNGGSHSRSGRDTNEEENRPSSGEKGGGVAFQVEQI